MIRPLAAVFVLSLVLLDGTPPSALGSGYAYPPSVLRIRGGFAFPDPDHQDPGPAWSAGGSVGVVLNRNILLSLSYDHIDLDEPDASFRRRAIDPLTLEVELGLPSSHRVTPRLAAGAGAYFHDDPRIVYSYYPGYAGPPQRSHVLGSSFGMHFGGGLSIPLWRRTLMDLDFRYHQTTGNDQAVVVGTATAGLRFLFPGGQADPDGYVDSGRAAVAAR